ncbi:MAG: molybdate ABC transporter substrate-binding protein [Bradyrhizobiaceae bacterium]|nr:molybdate ABC transporter substrate-binding protein [Bradyrhizobiaceae bacterium]
MGRSPFFTAARLAFVLAAALAFTAPAQAQDKPPLLVFAAASLKNALDEVNAAWTKQSGVEVRASYAASSALAKQLEEGAPADLFLSADIPWMDHIEKKNLVRAGTRGNLLGNSLVLIAPKDWKKGQVKIGPNFDLAGLLGDGRLSVGAVASVPAGRYAKASLEKLGIWPSVEKKLAEAENVRAAMAFVSRGEAPLGIVYSTDAAADPNVIVIGTFPGDSHPPIIYPVGVMAASKNPAAESYRKYLAGPDARKTFIKHGFTVQSGSSS